VPFRDPRAVTHTSRVYRHAISIIMSYLNYRSGAYNSSEADEHINKYRMEAIKCINQGTFAELEFAAYVVVSWSLMAGPSLETAIRYCLQFGHITRVLLRSSTENVDRAWVEDLWQDVLMSLYHIHLDVILFNCLTKPELLHSSLKDLQMIVDQSFSILPTEDEVSRLPRSMTTEMLLHKTCMLSIYLQYYLEYFLYQAIVNDNPTISPRKGLTDVLTRIAELIPRVSGISDYIHHAYLTPSSSAQDDELPGRFLHYPHLVTRGLKSEPRERDTTLAILYVFAKLLKGLLDPKPDDGILEEIRQSAIALCRLCASFTAPASPSATLLIKRTLFWARMGLTHPMFKDGNPPPANAI